MGQEELVKIMQIVDKNKVSIVMLSRNKVRFVDESVKSVLAQTYTNWELLFVDDNSKDGTITKLMELKDKIGTDMALKMRIIQTVNTRGATRNRNEALKAAKGRWVAFLDAGGPIHDGETTGGSGCMVDGNFGSGCMVQGSWQLWFSVKGE